MYRLLLIFSVLTICRNSDAQDNLVPNGSFEDYIDCPFSTAELITNCPPWESWQLTPDFFHECGDLNAGVPSNAWGVQAAFDGSGYASFITYESIQETREIIATPLSSPLEVGEEYRVEFSISFADGGIKSQFLAATNNIGFRFFQDPDFNQLNSFQPDNFAHFNIDTLVSDQSNWVTVEVFFTADQTYNYVAFGNFFDDENTEVLNLNSSDYAVAFYYIDAICIQKSEFVSCYPVGMAESSLVDLSFAYSEGTMMMSGLKGTESLISIYSVDGRLLDRATPSGSFMIFENLPPNRVVILQVIRGSTVLSQKIIVQ